MSDGQWNSGPGVYLVYGDIPADIAQAQAEFVSRWCDDNGVRREDLTILQLAEICGLPGWPTDQ